MSEEIARAFEKKKGQVEGQNQKRFRAQEVFSRDQHNGRGTGARIRAVETGMHGGALYAPISTALWGLRAPTRTSVDRGFKGGRE